MLRLLILVLFLGAAQRARAQAPSFTVDGVYANPTQRDVKHARPDERIEARQPVDCWMLVTTDEPVARFEVPSPVALSLWVEGAESARALVLTRDGTTEHCVPHTRTGAHELAATFGAGRWEVRLAYVAGERQLPRSVRVTLADLARPNTFSREAATLALARSQTQPMVHAGTTPEPRIFGGPGCERGVTFARDPSALLVLDTPLENLELKLADPTQGLWVIGPIDRAPFAWAPCDRVPTEWKASGARKGTYAVFVGDKGDHGARPFSLLLTHKGTVRDPLFFVPPPEGLSVAQRSLEDHLPFLPSTPPRVLESATFEARAQLATLFTRLPPTLMVYAAEDFAPGIHAPHFFPKRQALLLDGKVQPSGTELPAEAYPRQGEPLLLVARRDERGAVVATADGLLFSVGLDELATTGDARALPDRVRATLVPYDIEALAALAPPDAAKLLDPYQRAVDRFEACIDRAFGAYGEDAADNGVYRVHWDGVHFSYDEISDEIEERAYRTCGNGAVEKAFQVAWDALAKRVDAEASRRLDAARKPVATR